MSICLRKIGVCTGGNKWLSPQGLDHWSLRSHVRAHSDHAKNNEKIVYFSRFVRVILAQWKTVKKQWKNSEKQWKNEKDKTVKKQ